MKVSNQEVKKLIVDVLLCTDEVDDKGTRARRQSFERKYFKGRRSALSKITDTVEVGVINNKEPEKEVEWLKFGTPVNPPMKVVAERYTDAEIEFSAEEMESIRYYAKERNDLPDTTLEAFEEFEKITE